MKYLFPLIFKNNSISSFQFDDGIKIRKLEKKERQEFFGLEKIEFSFSNIKLPGYIGVAKFTPSKNKGRANYTDIFKKGLHDGSSDILAANYILEINSESSRENLNSILKNIDLSFKIFKPCSIGGISLCFQKNESGFSNFGIFSGPFFAYIDIQKKDLSTIKKTYKKIKNNSRENLLQIILEFYGNAIGGIYKKTHGISEDIKTRFILLVISLESLCLPNCREELKFRFSLRIAKILSKYHKFDSEQYFKFAKMIYDIRSEIVHNGKGNTLNSEIFQKTVDITNKLINIYIANETVFNPEDLDKICYKN